MNLPTLPTDSLYKFLSIAGLALIVLAPTYYQSYSWDVQRKRLDQQGEQRTLNDEAKYIVEDMNRITQATKEVVEETEKVTSQKPRNKAESERLRQRAIGLKEENQQLELKTREKLIKQTQIENLGRSVELYESQLAQLKTLSIVAFVVGIFLFSVTPMVYTRPTLSGYGSSKRGGPRRCPQ